MWEFTMETHIDPRNVNMGVKNPRVKSAVGAVSANMGGENPSVKIAVEAVFANMGG